MPKKPILNPEKDHLKYLASLFHVGDMVEFYDQYQQLQRGFIHEKNTTQYVIRHPNGAEWSIWVDQIKHKVWTLKWPGLCDDVREAQIDPTNIDAWLENLREMLPFASPTQRKAIQSLIRPLEYVYPLIEQDLNAEPVEPSYVYMHTIKEEMIDD